MEAGLGDMEVSFVADAASAAAGPGTRADYAKVYSLILCRLDFVVDC